MINTAISKSSPSPHNSAGPERLMRKLTSPAARRGLLFSVLFSLLGALLLISAPPADAQEPAGICGRSEPARDEILRGINSSLRSQTIDCSEVTASHLANSLQLYTTTIDGSGYAGDPVLKEGDFDGLTGVRILFVRNFDTMTTLPSVSGMTSLKNMQVRNIPQLTSVPDLSALTAFERLGVFGGNLTSPPDLSKNTKLAQLSLYNNNLTALPDLSKNTKLTYLSVSGNNLTTLPDLSKNTELKTLYLDDGNLTALPDLSKNTKLGSVTFHDNNLTTLPDLSKNINIHQLWVNDNNLTALPDLSKHTRLTDLQALNNNLTALPDLSKNTRLRSLKVGGNNLTELPDLSQNTALTDLNVNDIGLAALPDLSRNTALEYLWARNNRLTALPDLSKNTELTKMSVRGNRLTALPDLSKNTALTHLWVYDNRLTELPDLSRNTALTALHAYDNRIYPLPDLSANAISDLKMTPQSPASFGVAAAEADEGSSAQLTVTLSETTSSTLPFSVAVAYGSGEGAADSNDLGDLPTSVEVPPGGNSATFSIPIAADDAEEGDETFTVSVSTDTPGWKPESALVSASREPATTTVTIKNVTPEAPDESEAPKEIERPAATTTAPTAAAKSAVKTLRFKKTSVEAVEGENSKIRITRSGDTSSAVEVTLSYANGSATSPGDYNASARTVSIPSGKRFKNISLPIIDDSVDEDDETFTVSLASDAEGYTVGGSATVTVTIKDDDTAGVNLSKTAVNVNETGKKAYKISLDSKPTADVTITATSGDPEKATLNKAATTTLTFTPENWNKGRKVTIRAKLVGDNTISVTHIATSTDPKYRNVAIAPVSVTIVALETPGPVTNLQVSAVRDNSVTVTWDAPTVGEQLQRYTAYLEPQGEAKGKVPGEFKRPYHPKQSVVFRDLRPGVTYKVHVWVRNNKPGKEGKSERVTSDAFTVPEDPSPQTSPPSG